jgi:hypothetical protein
VSARPESRESETGGASSALRSVDDYLDRAARRVTRLAVMQGTALGLALATVALVALFATGAWSGSGDVTQTVALGLLGAAAGSIAGLARRPGRDAVARDIDRRAHLRNVLVTSDEIERGETAATPGVAARVHARAAALVATVDLRAMFPALPALRRFAGAALVYAAVVAMAMPGSIAPIVGHPGSRSADLASVDVTVIPPAYTGLALREHRNPARVDAPAGSLIRVTVAAAAAAAVEVETLAGRATPMTRTASGAFATELRADADGFIALSAVGADGRQGGRRLIGLAVTPDRAPRVRVTAPARDLFLLPADASRTIDIAVEADDDLALGSLQLRYTRVSGFGERFTFVDGEIPLTVSRTDGRVWSARAGLALAPLALESGDMIVYRAVATDRRPGAPASESDSYIVEVGAPGSLAADGFAADDLRDRYGISQQMVILETERLIARRGALPRDSVADRSATLAAAQRSVRAEFVFMMGGELAEEILAAAGMGDLNEEAHAHADEDLFGRTANQGQISLVRAIRAMSQATTLLNRVDLETALQQEKLALRHLQQAFARSRYILRALTERERLDLSRRLTGVLSAASGSARPASAAPEDTVVTALRSVLASLAASTAMLAEDRDAVPARARAFGGLAQRVLAIDPASEELRAVASQLADADAAVARDVPSAARSTAERAVVSLSRIVRARLASPTSVAPNPELDRLAGTLTDLLRGTVRR